MANELKMVFGSPTTVISHAAALAAGANTFTGMTGCTMTLLDNSTLLYPYAKAVLTVPTAAAAALTAGGTFDLYMTEDDIDGTTDETPVPAVTDIIYLAKYKGSWVVDNQTSPIVDAIVISLEGVQKARFYILNSSGQATVYTATPLTVKITPFSYMPT
jgi:hypothetical protein